MTYDLATRHDRVIQDYERSVGIKMPQPVTPQQRRAYLAALGYAIDITRNAFPDDAVVKRVVARLKEQL